MDLQSALRDAGCCLQSRKPVHGMLAIRSAHDRLGLQAGAHGRTPRVTEDGAAMVISKLYASDARRLAMGHAGNR
ncbi:hypothetical protein GCM10011408_04490 [Dyella caseinilytica]|nr:hypothetical protein GCM10011408_04490 [Dyella caseinilytica]